MQSSERKNKKIIQVEGSFFSNYSLAIVNRNLALAMDGKDEEYDVRIYADKSIADYIPTADELDQNPALKRLYTDQPGTPDIAIRYQYPHDLIPNMTGKYNFIYLGWEETLLPKKSVEIFNKYLDGIIVPANFVKETAIRSGVTIPIEVIPHGVTPMIDAGDKAYKLPTKKNFKFFHNSSCYPRKGIDVLLNAYFDEFTSEDDVCLVIKTIPNPHNDVEQQIAALQKTHKQAPEVVVINTFDLTWQEMGSIYHACQVVVLPTRGEGFGLPQAEALLAKKPLITTGFSAPVDFCTPENSWLIDYKLAPSTSHVTSDKSMWAEPSVKDLRYKMRFLFEHYETQEVKDKVENGFELISSEYTWDKAAEKFIEFFKFFEKVKCLKKMNLGVLSTWNTKCGIAKYSGDFYGAPFSYFNEYSIFATKEIPVFKDEPYVKRFWMHLQRIDLAEYKEALNSSKLDLVHIQHQPGFFSIDMLSELVAETDRLKKLCVVTLHSLEEFENYVNSKFSIEDIIKNLNLAQIIYSHREEDTEFLRSIGLKNVKTIPHGNIMFDDEDRYSLRKALDIRSKHVVSSHGFLLPHKGFHHVIESIKMLKGKYPDILYIMATAMHSTNDKARKYYHECMRLIKKHKLQDNVLIFNEFLSPDELIGLLHTSDVIVLPYADTKDSASGAIRYCLASNRPVVVSPANIFKEVQENTVVLDSIDAEEITKKITELFTKKDLVKETKKKAKQFIEKNSWEKISKRYLEDIAVLCDEKLKDLNSK